MMKTDRILIRLGGIALAASFFACDGAEQTPTEASGWQLDAPAVEFQRTGANVGTNLDVILAKAPTVSNLRAVDPAGQFALRAEGERVVADVLVKVERDRLKGVVKDLAALGATVRTITNSGIMTVTLPLDSADDASEVEGIERIEVSRRVRMYNDLSKQPEGLNVPLADQPGAPDGAGVIVGIIDSGLDWSHGDFRNADGTTRVLALWDQSDVADQDIPAGFTFGTEYSQAEINDCLADPVPEGAYCVQVDDNGHGTHVAGTAAGNGLETGEFAGAAPAADILFVKFDFDGDRNSDAAIIDGVDWIFQQAGNRPVVINMSLGSDYGPHDQSTLEERAIDDLIGPGKLVVAAAGNAGRTGEAPNNELWGYPIHGEGNFGDGTCSNITVNIPEGYTPDEVNYVFWDIWYSGSEKNRVQITTPSGAKYPSSFDKRSRTTWTTGGPISAFNTPEGYLLVGNGGDLLDWSTDNGDHELYVEISDANDGTPPAAGEWTICIYGTDVRPATNGNYHAWHGTSRGLTATSLSYDGAPSDNRYTVGAPGSASKVIAVGAYTTRMGWEYRNPHTGLTGCQNYNVAPLDYYDAFYLDTILNGIFDYDFGGDCHYDPDLGDTAEPFNELAFFSSRGPLRNGVLKPDVSAPGVGTMSSLSSTVLAEEIASGTGYHGDRNRIHPDLKHAVLQGTSMASPNATGGVALLLAADPTLDPTSLRALLDQSARADSYTGPLPNEDWGRGKFDVAAALDALTCDSDAECDDSNECTTDACVANKCTNTVLADGTACGAGLCCAGSCAAPACDTDASCDDSSTCTDEVCVGSGTCNAACEYSDNGSCVCAAPGESCTDNGDCCVGTCNGRPGRKTCK